MHKKHWIRLGMVGAAALATATTVSAASYAAAANATSYTQNSGNPPSSDGASGASPTGVVAADSTASETASIPGPFGSAVGNAASSSTAQAGVAALDLFASAGAQIVNDPNSVSMSAAGISSSSARFQDSFVVRCTGLAACADGQRGSMTVGYWVLGNAAGGGSITTGGVRYNGGYSGYAQWAAGLNLTSMNASGLVDVDQWTGGQTVRESEAGSSVGEYNMSFPHATFGLKEVTIDFTFGGTVYVDLYAMLGAEGRAGYDSSGSSSQTASQSQLTPTWGGVLRISGAGGAALDGASGLSALSADTGFDYLNSALPAVPEPGTLALWCAGLLGVGVVARRRRTR